MRSVFVGALALGALLLAGSAPQAASASKTLDCPEGATGGLNLSQGECIKVRKAKLVKGEAIAPASAPEKVKRVIERANEIRHKPYDLGGGHSSFRLDSHYDCSGAVSYALRGLGREVLPSPLASPALMSWGRKGKGKWITVYSDLGHAYMVVAGLRFDTANNPEHLGSGPRWSKSLQSTSGSFAVRSWPGF